MIFVFVLIFCMMCPIVVYAGGVLISVNDVNIANIIDSMHTANIYNRLSYPEYERFVLSGMRGEDRYIVLNVSKINIEDGHYMEFRAIDAVYGIVLLDQSLALPEEEMGPFVSRYIKKLELILKNKISCNNKGVQFDFSPSNKNEYELEKTFERKIISSDGYNLVDRDAIRDVVEFQDNIIIYNDGNINIVDRLTGHLCPVELRCTLIRVHGDRYMFSLFSPATANMLYRKEIRGLNADYLFDLLEFRGHP